MAPVPPRPLEQTTSAAATKQFAERGLIRDLLSLPAGTRGIMAAPTETVNSIVQNYIQQ
jgi:hypothetical protein